jgi:hypothetical protein
LCAADEGRNGIPGQPTDWFSWSTGAENAFLAPFLMQKTDSSTKTGSGQTWRKFNKRDALFFAGDYWLSHDWSWANTSSLYERCGDDDAIYLFSNSSFSL